MGQYKELVMPFRDNSWPENATCITSTENACRGHHAYDLTFWEATVLDANGTYVQRHYTNQEIREMIRPTDYRMPYVYSQFQWPHCDAQGYVFSSPTDLNK